jgi:hypothetical protein
MASKPTPNGSKDSSGSKASESKRLFDDTPQKDKQNEPKKQKNFWDIPSDDDSDPFRASGPQKSSPKASGFNIPPVGPAPKPKPNFKMSNPLADDDIEISPTRASSTPPPRRVLPVTPQAMSGASFAAPTGMSSRLPVSVPRRSLVSSSTINPPSMGSRQQVGTSDRSSGSGKVTPGSDTGSDDGVNGSRPRSATSSLANKMSHLHVVGRSRSITPDDESDTATPPKRASSPKACLTQAERQISEPSDASDEGRSQVLKSLASVRRSRAIPGVILDSDDEEELDDSDESEKAKRSLKPVDEEDESTEDEEAQTNVEPQDEEENLVRSEADPESSDAAGAEDEIDEEDDDEDPTKAYSNLMSRVAEEVYEESQREMDQDLDEETQVPQTQATLPNGSSTYEDYSSKLIEAYNEGLESLVRVALYLRGMPCDIWVQRRIASGPVKYENLMFTLWLIMAGWDPLILEHLVHGDLPAAALTDAELEKKLRKLKNIPAINECCPCIYMQYLVDTIGKSPTPEILGKILDFVEMYAKAEDVKDMAFVARIDSALASPNWGRISAIAGRKRYLESPEQTKTCLNWAKAARERMEGLPMNEPLVRPWAECGYATYPTERLDQYAKHNSSNYLMNLTDAICRLEFPSYRIRQYVVHHIVHYTHAMYDEILASRVSLAYTTQGGGWCHFRAGVSHRGAQTKARPEHFSRKQMALMTDQKFRIRLTDEIQKIEKMADFNEEFANKVVEQRENVRETLAVAQLIREQQIKASEDFENSVKELEEEVDRTLAMMDFEDGLSDDGSSEL